MTKIIESTIEEFAIELLEKQGYQYIYAPFFVPTSKPTGRIVRWMVLMVDNLRYNPNIHHRRSIRLREYDYSQAGLYFITICTHNRLCLFGEIRNGEMVLNDAGDMAEKYLLAIPEHFPQTKLCQFIVMPNHIHCIIEITVGAKNLSPGNALGLKRANNHSPLRSPSKTIGSVVRGFKIGVTKWFRGNTDIYTVWQRGFYDHIIRNENSCYQISEYIQTNPLKWQDDKYYE